MVRTFTRRGLTVRLHAAQDVGKKPPERKCDILLVTCAGFEPAPRRVKAGCAADCANRPANLEIASHSAEKTPHPCAGVVLFRNWMEVRSSAVAAMRSRRVGQRLRFEPRSVAPEHNPQNVTLHDAGVRVSFEKWTVVRLVRTRVPGMRARVNPAGIACERGLPLPGMKSQSWNKRNRVA